MPSVPPVEIKRQSSCLPGKCFTDSAITGCPAHLFTLRSASPSRFGTNVLSSRYGNFVSFPLSDREKLGSHPMDITPEVTRVPGRREASGKHFVKKEHFPFTL